MIDWKKYFDAVYVLHYAGYNEIEQHLMSELKRVGLSDSGILHIHENISSSFLRTLKKNVDCEDRLKNDSTFSCSFGHYSILKIIELKNYSNVLILEDDVTFLKDIDQIQKILDQTLIDIPNYDLCLFSHFQTPCSDIKEEIPKYVNEMQNAAKNNQMFIPYNKNSAPVSSAACYAVSRKGSIMLRGLYEHQMQIADIIFRNSPFLRNTTVDNFHSLVLDSLKSYYCRVPISLQKNIQQSMTNNILGKNFDIIMQKQKQIAEYVGIKYSNYNF